MTTAPPVLLSQAARHNLDVLLRARPNANAWLYGVVDSAADESLYERLQAEPAASRVTCLFDGYPAISYRNTAPYLVLLHEHSPLGADWLQTGWQRHWGIWLSSAHPLEHIKTHLKKFLFVQRPHGQKAYFRFYDPRVLDQVMPAFNAGQRGEFFGLNHRRPLDACFSVTRSTANSPRLLRYTPQQDLSMRFAQGSRHAADAWPWR